MTKYKIEGYTENPNWFEVEIEANSEEEARDGKEALRLLRKAKKGDMITWDERTETEHIYESFVKQ